MSRREGRRIERIEFPSWNPYMPGDMARPAVREKRIRGKGTLFLPEAAYVRPRPAVVIVHGLGGPKKAREFAYGHRLAREGYVVLMINSFSTRHVGYCVQLIRAVTVTTAMILADTFAALKFLSDHPLVDDRRIAVAGFSFGGMIAGLAAYRQMSDLYMPDGPVFAAHVSYYGSSIPRLDDHRTTGAPVLMMLGSKDKNVSIPRSQEIAADLRSGGSDVRLEIFDAHHQWDGGHRVPDRMLFQLRHCQIRIERDGTVRNEKTGGKIEGFWSHLWFLLRNAVPSGYVLKRDDRALRQSNAQLLSFLNTHLGSGVRTNRGAGTPHPPCRVTALRRG